MNNQFNLVPFPNEIKKLDGKLNFNRIETISYPINLETIVRQFLKDLKRVFGDKITKSCQVIDIESDSNINYPNDSFSIKILNNDKNDQYSYLIDLSSTVATICVSDENGLNNAFSTFIQLIRQEENSYSVPKVIIKDTPYAKYRGLLIDIARKKHKLKTLKQMVLLCYFYKLNYLHIHFTDNQSYTLPSKAFPKLPTKKKSFTTKEINELVVFAEIYGVTIIPEIDLPGHSRSIVQAMPELFAINSKSKVEKVINFGKEEVYDAIEILISELCELFPNSPYIHLGADEVGFNGIEEDIDVQNSMGKNKIESVEELYRLFIVRLNEMVKKHKKRLCIWEGFRPNGKVEIPKDILIYEFESQYTTPDLLLEDGYELINTSWKPIYVVPRKSWSPEEIYRWNMYRWENWTKNSPATKNPYQFKPTKQVLGAQMCSWEQKDKNQVRVLKERLASFSENVWNQQKAEEEFGKISNEKVNGFLQRLNNIIPLIDKFIKI